MNKKTQMIIGIVAVAGIGYWLLTKKKDKVFANLLAGGSKTAPGCKVYGGSCNAPVGTILYSWENGGGYGIIVASNSTRCIVCPKSDTPSGMPKEW